MGRLRKAVLWYLLLNKRFLKKYIYPCLLLMLPLLVLGIRAAAKQDGGVLRVVLCASEGSETEKTTVKSLMEKNGVIQYQWMEGEESACQTVRSGDADCAWIFPDQIQTAVREYLNGERESVLSVYVREDNIPNKLAREQLYGVLYPVISYEITRQFVDKQDMFSNMDIGTLENNLQRLYENNQVNGSIFRFAYLDGSTINNADEKMNYMTAPLRGLLSLLVLLSAMAVTMFYIQDDEEKLYVWMPIRHRQLFPWLYIVTGTLPTGFAACIALRLSGTFTSWGKELLLMFLYVISIAGFCNLLRRICRKKWNFGAVIPIILLVSLVLCPVFLTTRRFPVVQYLLPAYYYLNSVYSTLMMFRFCIYGAVLFSLSNLKIFPQSV
ncbi:MAG: hypothetical protein SOW34_08635 [Oliverpabstia sp.]|nr:ABC transporter permease [Eubacterium sp.]MDY2594949.1 hypothetical protein [Oliverpabstia sp.]